MTEIGKRRMMVVSVALLGLPMLGAWLATAVKRAWQRGIARRKAPSSSSKPMATSLTLSFRQLSAKIARSGYASLTSKERQQLFELSSRT